MDLDDKQIKEYFYHRCLYPYDINGADICARKLNELSKHLPPQEYQTLEVLNSSISQLNKLLSEENDDRDGTPQDEQLLKRHEHLLDTTPMPAEYRAMLYEVLLTGIEKYGHNEAWYYSVLRKKINHLAPGDDHELNYAAFQTMLHRYYLPQEAKENMMAAIYEKLKNKKHFSYTSELGDAYKKMLRDKKRQASINKHRASFFTIEKQLRTQNLPSGEEESLLLEELRICGKCGFGRCKNFSIKAQACHRLKNLYACRKEYENMETFAEQERHWNRMKDNAIRHARNKNPNNGR